MTTQSVTYCTRIKLDCCPITEVVLCVPTVVTVSGLGFIDASLTVFEVSGLSCSNSSYQYTFEYDDAQLISPGTPLTGVEISGVICSDCLTRWIEDRQIVTSSDLIFTQTIFRIRPQDIVSENSRIFIDSSGQNSNTGGALISVSANQAGGGNNGNIGLISGDASNAHITLTASASNGFVNVQVAALETWRFNASGQILQEAINGSDIVFTKATTAIQLQSGANGRTGTFSMNGAAAVVVANTSLAAGDQIFISRDTPAGTPGAFNLTARTNGVSFTVTGTALDTSGMRYTLIRIN